MKLTYPSTCNNCVSLKHKSVVKPQLTWLLTIIGTLVINESLWNSSRICLERSVCHQVARPQTWSIKILDVFMEWDWNGSVYCCFPCQCFSGMCMECYSESSFFLCIVCSMFVITLENLTELGKVCQRRETIKLQWISLKCIYCAQSKSLAFPLNILLSWLTEFSFTFENGCTSLSWFS